MSGHLPGRQQLPGGQGLRIQDQLGPAPLRDLNSCLESFFKFFIVVCFDVLSYSICFSDFAY